MMTEEHVCDSCNAPFCDIRKTIKTLKGRYSGTKHKMEIKVTKCHHKARINAETEEG